MRSWRDWFAVALASSLVLVACGDDEGAGEEDGASEGADGSGGGAQGDAGAGGGGGVDDGEISPEVRFPPATLADRSCPPDSGLTWENVGAPFILAYCTGCHASTLEGDWRREAPVGVDFDDVGAVRVFADRIWARAGDHNDTMPPIGGPPREERVLFGEWLACGAP